MGEITRAQEERIKQNMTVLGNANELLVGVISELAGNDIADSLNGSPLTRATIISIAQSTFKQALTGK